MDNHNDVKYVLSCPNAKVDHVQINFTAQEKRYICDAIHNQIRKIFWNNIKSDYNKANAKQKLKFDEEIKKFKRLDGEQQNWALRYTDHKTVTINWDNVAKQLKGRTALECKMIWDNGGITQNTSINHKFCVYIINSIYYMLLI